MPKTAEKGCQMFNKKFFSKVLKLKAKKGPLWIEQNAVIAEEKNIRKWMVPFDYRTFDDIPMDPTILSTAPN